MKTTVDLPDDLLRRAKAAAALRGIKLREMVQDGLLRVLNDPEPNAERCVSAFDLMEDACGVVSSQEGDLSTNPAHMDSFGDE